MCECILHSIKQAMKMCCSKSPSREKSKARWLIGRWLRMNGTGTLRSLNNFFENRSKHIVCTTRIIISFSREEARNRRFHLIAMDAVSFQCLLPSLKHAAFQFLWTLCPDLYGRLFHWETTNGTSSIFPPDQSCISGMN